MQDVIKFARPFTAPVNDTKSPTKHVQRTECDDNNNLKVPVHSQLTGDFF